MMNVRTLIAMCLVLVACGKAATPSGSGSASGSVAASTDAPPAVDAAPMIDAATISDSCTSPDDCAIGCLSGPSDCCGDACGCEHPYTKERLKEVEAERERICARKDVDCPRVRCMARRFWPGCENGRCIAVAVPVQAECVTDADCTTSTAVEGRCCTACDESVWVKKELDAYHAWAKAQCASVECPQRTCPSSKPVKARCAGGACVMVRP